MKKLIAFAAAAAVSTAALAQDKIFAARVELHPIPSLTLSDEQFLKGDPGGKPVTVTGHLRIAQSATPRTPVDVQFSEYPNAQHGFDNPLGTLAPAVAKNAQTVRNFKLGAPA